MTRDFVISGPCLVRVKGRSDSPIGAIAELGLSDTQIHVQVSMEHRPLTAEAWGGKPADFQMMLGVSHVSFGLIHFDNAVLQACVQESMAGGTVFGRLPQTGQRLGNNLPRFAPSGGIIGAGNHYIGLNLSSPVLAFPWRFLYSVLVDPIAWPLGAEKEVVQTRWMVVPYTQDPYVGINAPGTGLAAQEQALWDNVADS